MQAENGRKPPETALQFCSHELLHPERNKLTCLMHKDELASAGRQLAARLNDCTKVGYPTSGGYSEFSWDLVLRPKRVIWWKVAAGNSNFNLLNNSR